MLELGQIGKVPYHHLFELTYDTRDGSTITVHQTRGLASSGTWAYEAAVSLARYMESDEFAGQFGSVRDKTVVELGAGTGIVGLVAAAMGADSIVTDLETLLPLMAYNVQQNDVTLKGKAAARAYSWGDDVSKVFDPATSTRVTADYVILANCVYYEGVLEMLAQSVDELCGRDTVVLASYEDRTPEVTILINRWHRIIEGHGFKVDSIDWTDGTQSDFVRLAYYRRKA